VLPTKVWRRLLGIDAGVVLEGIEFDEDAEAVVAHVRCRRPTKLRCGRCSVRAPRYDEGRGRRRWRSLDLGPVQVFLEGAAPRVRCPEHGVVVGQVPWARHDTGHTRAFDDTVAWLVTQASKTATAELLRVAWRTVGSIITRVIADLDGQIDRLANLRRIGIDEISYKRGHRYLTVVVDHDSGRLLWAAPGRDEATLNGFFTLLGPERCAEIRQVSADAAPWIATAVAAHCPQAVLAADPFHVVRWANDALDEVRRHAWNHARRAHELPKGREARRNRQHRAHPIKRARYALWKNPEDLTANQAAQLDWIARTQPEVHRAYLLKEGLRLAFRLKGDAGKQALDRWISWARRSRIPAFVELQRRIVRHRRAIDTALDTGLSQGLIESTNTKIRLLARLAFGFKNPDALVALALLALGGYRPDLPGRA
jgi:transposase